MCKYCEDGILIIDAGGAVLDGSTSVYIKDGSLIVDWVANDPWYGDDEQVDINYCPMCGKKMEEIRLREHRIKLENEG